MYAAAAFSVVFTAFFHMFKTFLPRREGGGDTLLYKLYQYVHAAPNGMIFEPLFV